MISVIMLSVIILIVIMLSVIMLSVIVLSVVAPLLAHIARTCTFLGLAYRKMDVMPCSVKYVVCLYHKDRAWLR
jgi:hypothetical protein